MEVMHFLLLVLSELLQLFHFMTQQSKQKQKEGSAVDPRFGWGFGFVMNDFLNIGRDAEYHKGFWNENILNLHTEDSELQCEKQRIDYNNTIAKINSFKY
jgi:hypothetical protein